MNELNTEGVCAESQEDQVRKLDAKLALHPDPDFGWNRGKENAKQIDCDEQMLDQIPDVVWESSGAVGNSFSAGPINTGETVVDMGCGAGADLCVAALEMLISETGFQDVTCLKMTGYHTAPETEGAIFRATQPETLAATSLVVQTR
jgi:hypothetical protein